MSEATLQDAGSPTSLPRVQSSSPDATSATDPDDWTRLDTPALLVDLDRLERNLGRMSDHAARNGLALRPHFKTHKSVAIARRQLEAGAVGITVAKLDEAEALVDAGVDASILLAYQVVAAPKLDRAIALAARGRLALAVDGVEGARRLDTAARNAGLRLEVWIEIDSGLQRCGVPPAGAPGLARALATLDGVHLGGMFTHAGQSYAAHDVAEVEAIANAEAAAVIDAASATRAIGIEVPVVSAGSTPTARFLVGDGGLTEMRPGTYVFYDALQVALGSATAEDCALTVATTVVSRPTAERAVIDAGSKTLGLDRGAHSSSLLTDFGSLVGVPGRLVRLSEEHGILEIPADSPLAVGDRIRVVPNHVCSVTNLGRLFHGHRDGIVEEVMTIDAAGGVH